MSGQPWQLPPHAAAEGRLLARHGIASWDALARLSDPDLLQMAGEGHASATTLRRLRGQARLIVAADLEPAQAALLLHAGIADARGLALCDPQRLWVQTGRLHRRLIGQAATPPDLAAVQRWIIAARRAGN